MLTVGSPACPPHRMCTSPRIGRLHVSYPLDSCWLPNSVSMGSGWCCRAGGSESNATDNPSRPAARPHPHLPIPNGQTTLRLWQIHHQMGREVPHSYLNPLGRRQHGYHHLELNDLCQLAQMGSISLASGPKTRSLMQRTSSRPSCYPRTGPGGRRGAAPGCDYPMWNPRGRRTSPSVTR